GRARDGRTRGPGGRTGRLAGTGGRPPRPPRRRTVVRRSDPVRRLNVVLVLVAFVLSLFAGRLVQLQGIESQGYAQRAVRQRLIAMDLPAVRGRITDRFGQPLAMTVDARAIYADPTMVDPAQKGKIASVLAPLLDVPAEEIARKISV